MIVELLKKSDYYYWLQLPFAELCKLRQVSRLFNERILRHLDNPHYQLSEADWVFVQKCAQQANFKERLRRQPFAIFELIAGVLLESKLLQELADENHPSALYALRDRKFTADQLSNPKDNLVRAAVLNHPLANLVIGSEYFFGKALPQNYPQAEQYLLKAVKVNNRALLILAFVYQGEQRIDRSYALLRNAAEEGFTSAQRNLGIGLSDDTTLVESEKWLRNAACQNDPIAKKELANLLAEQERAKEALFWRVGSFNREDPNEQYHHGLFLHTIGFKQGGTRWIERAASQNYATAQYELGKCFSEGIGCEKSECRALYWFDQAGKHGHPAAQVLADSLRKKLGPVREVWQPGTFAFSAIWHQAVLLQRKKAASLN